MIYQMLPSERPDDETIEDDGALDRWYESYQREMARKHGKNKQTSAADFATVPQFSL